MLFRSPPQAELEKLNLQKSVPIPFLGLSFEEIFYSKILKPEKISMKTYEPLYAEIESFIQCVKEDTRPVVSGEDGAEAVRIAHMVIQDIQKNLERVKQRFPSQTN